MTGFHAALYRPPDHIVIGGAAGARVVCAMWQAWQYEHLACMNYYGKRGTAPAFDMGDWRTGENLKLLRDSNTFYFVATGDNLMRRALTLELLEKAEKWPISVVSEHVVFFRESSIGYGTLICPRTVIHVGASIGNGCIINTGAIVEHDNVIEDYAQISPGAVLGGYVTVKEGAFVAMGAIVLPHVTIGEWSIVAAGAVVTEDVPPYTMVAGVPAVLKKKLEAQGGQAAEA